jgi:hypothetical protein
LQTVRLLFVIFLAIAPAVAENPWLDKAPREACDETNAPSASSKTLQPIAAETTTAETTTVKSTNAYVLAAASILDAPTPRRARVIDKKYIFVMAALGGAESLRFTTHKLVLDREYAAGAPWVTSVPPNQHLVVKYGAIYAAELLVTYELKKPHSWLPEDKIIRKLWWTYPATMAPIHIMNGVRSIRTQAPSGCPVADCQGQ